MKKTRSFRFLVAIFAARVIASLMRLLGRNATHFPGRVARRLCPDFLARLEKPDVIIGITGTNGKTTVSNLIADLARAFGADFAHNAYGSNIEEGIISTLLDATTFFGKKKKPLAILELDERYTRVIFQSLVPDVLIVTNLFRESYLRNAHAEFIYDILDDSIPHDTKLIVNADDLLSHRLAEGRSAVSFGIARLPGEPRVTHNLIRDVTLCPTCGLPLTDDFIRYHHIGRAHCDVCGRRSPDPEYEVTELRDDAGHICTYDRVAEATTLALRHGDETALYPFIGENLLDLYNETAAIALFRQWGHAPAEIARALGALDIGASRRQISTIGPHTLYRMLAKGKNPIAVTRVIDALVRRPGEKRIILLVDTSTETMSAEDNTAWIFDADLRLLADPSVTQIVVGGFRAEEIHTALLFAGVPDDRIVTCRNKLDVTHALTVPETPCTIGVLYELYSDHLSQQIAEKIRGNYHTESDHDH